MGELAFLELGIMQLRVIQDSDNLGVGNIDAQVGMKLANGYTVVKINDKSIIGENHAHTDKLFSPISIYYTQAADWGFTCSDVDDQTEQLAAINKIFGHGERKFRLYHQNGYVLPLSDRIEQAGYNFAKEMQANRETVVLELTNNSKQKESYANGDS